VGMIRGDLVGHFWERFRCVVDMHLGVGVGNLTWRRHPTKSPVALSSVPFASVSTLVHNWKLIARTVYNPQLAALIE
jgi:hypothetical protein